MICLAAILMAAGQGCRSTKTIQTVISKRDSGSGGADSVGRRDSIAFMNNIYNAVQANRLPFEWFSGKVKVVFEGSDGKKNDFNAFVRMRKDSIIWISVNAVLGIEAFRILITPDSVKVLNKLEKVLQLRSVNSVRELTKLPFTFFQLQDMFIGSPIYFNDNLVSYKKEGELVSVLSVGNVFKHLLSVQLPNHIMVYGKIDDVDPTRARTASFSYGDYETWNNRPFSTLRRISLSEKSKLDIEMKYKQFEFNGPLNFPFSIPKNYNLQ